MYKTIYIFFFLFFLILKYIIILIYYYCFFFLRINYLFIFFIIISECIFAHLAQNISSDGIFPRLIIFKLKKTKKIKLSFIQITIIFAHSI